MNSSSIPIFYVMRLIFIFLLSWGISEKRLFRAEGAASKDVITGCSGPVSDLGNSGPLIFPAAMKLLEEPTLEPCLAVNDLLDRVFQKQGQIWISEVDDFIKSLSLGALSLILESKLIIKIGETPIQKPIGQFTLGRGDLKLVFENKCQAAGLDASQCKWKRLISSMQASEINKTSEVTRSIEEATAFLIHIAQAFDAYYEFEMRKKLSGTLIVAPQEVKNRILAGRTSEAPQQNSGGSKKSPREKGPAVNTPTTKADAAEFQKALQNIDQEWAIIDPQRISLEKKVGEFLEQMNIDTLADISRQQFFQRKLSDHPEIGPKIKAILDKRLAAVLDTKVRGELKSLILAGGGAEKNSDSFLLNRAWATIQEYLSIHTRMGSLSDMRGDLSREGMKALLKLKSQGRLAPPSQSQTPQSTKTGVENIAGSDRVQMLRKQLVEGIISKVKTESIDPDESKLIAAKQMVPQYEAFLKSLKKALFERDDLIDMFEDVLIGKEHILMIGTTGNAKTSAVRNTIDNILFEGKPSTFSIQMTKKTTPNELFGPFHPGRLLQDHTYERMWSESMLAAHFVFIDEIFDGAPGSRRDILTVMIERKFRQGVRTIDLGRTYSIFAATNKPLAMIYENGSLDEDDDSPRALLNRFSRIVLLAPDLQKLQSFLGLAQRAKKKSALIDGIDVPAIDTLHSVASQVEIPEAVIASHAKFHKLYRKATELAEASSVAEFRRKKADGEVDMPFPYRATKKVSPGLFVQAAGMLKVQIAKEFLHGKRDNLTATVDDLLKLAPSYMITAIGMDLDTEINRTPGLMEKHQYQTAKDEMTMFRTALNAVIGVSKQKTSTTNIQISEHPDITEILALAQKLQTAEASLSLSADIEVEDITDDQLSLMHLIQQLKEALLKVVSLYERDQSSSSQTP